MVKKILVFLFGLGIMLTTTLCLAKDVTVRVGTTGANPSGNRGQTVVIPIIVGDTTGLEIISMDLWLTYDSTVFSDPVVLSLSGTIIQDTWSSPPFYNYIPGAGTLKELYVAIYAVPIPTVPIIPNYMSGAGTILMISFTVKSDAPLGLTDLTLRQVNLDGAQEVPTRLTSNQFSVTDVNLAPVLAPIPDKSVKALETLTFTVSATDPNPGDTLTYSASGLPTGATFNPATRTFSWTPTIAQIKSSAYKVTFKVEDNRSPKLNDSQAVNITVTKQTTYALTITAVNGSVTKKVRGSVKDSPYDPGTVVELTAVPATGYHFTGWSDDLSGSANPANITMDGHKSVTANFAINTYTLIINAAHGSVTKSLDQVTYNHDTRVCLTAIPEAGYSFKKWSGGLTGTSNPGCITMDSNKTVTAEFQIRTYTLTATVNYGGSVTKNPNKNEYDYNTVVTLRAVPKDASCSFVRWEGDLSGNTNPTTITTNNDKSVIAIFDDNTPPDNGVLVIDEGEEYTNVTKVHLDVSARESGSGIAKIQFSNDGLTWASPKKEKKSGKMIWDFTSGDGLKTVYVRVIDVAGNISAVFSNTITLDTQPPAKPTVECKTTGIELKASRSKDADFYISPKKGKVKVLKKLELAGAKEANTSIWLNGKEVVPINGETLWSYTVELKKVLKNTNILIITVKDAAENVSARIKIRSGSQWDPLH